MRYYAVVMRTLIGAVLAASLIAATAVWSAAAGGPELAAIGEAESLRVRLRVILEGAATELTPPLTVPAAGYHFNASEDLAVGAEVGRLPGEGGRNLRYRLQSVGIEAEQRLTVSASGVVRVGPAGLDYEADDDHSHRVAVMVTNGGGAAATAAVTVHLLDVNEPPIVPPGGMNLALPYSLMVVGNSRNPFRSCDQPVYPANGNRRGYKTSRVMSGIFEQVTDPEGGALSWTIAAGNPAYTDGAGVTREGFCIDAQGYLRVLYAALILHDSSLWPDLTQQQLDSLDGGFTGQRSEPIHLQVTASDPQGNTNTVAIRIAPNQRARDAHARCEKMSPGSRWRCHHLREELPHPAPVTTTADRLTLPAGLSQPGAHYDLVLRDEFEGDEINTDLWSWRYRPPEVRNGKLSLVFVPRLVVDDGFDTRPATSEEIADSRTAKRCAYSGRTIFMQARYQYGYMEFDITRNLQLPGAESFIVSYPGGDLDAAPDHVFHTRPSSNTVAPGKPTLRDVLSLEGAEIDVFEQISNWQPRFRDPSWNQMRVHSDFVVHYGTGQFRGSNGNYRPADFRIGSVLLPSQYNSGRTWRQWYFKTSIRAAPAVKIGWEWTPAGFRLFRNGRQITYANENCGNSGKDDAVQRCQFSHQFAWISPADYSYRSGVAMSENGVIPYGVPHVPQSLNVHIGGEEDYYSSHPPKPACDGTVETCCETGEAWEIDYLRIWKPRDNYADVKPVYQ